jgi:hypothetical protein
VRSNETQSRREATGSARKIKQTRRKAAVRSFCLPQINRDRQWRKEHSVDWTGLRAAGQCAVGQRRTIKVIGSRNPDRAEVGQVDRSRSIVCSGVCGRLEVIGDAQHSFTDLVSEGEEEEEEEEEDTKSNHEKWKLVWKRNGTCTPFK